MRLRLPLLRTFLTFDLPLFIASFKVMPTQTRHQLENVPDWTNIIPASRVKVLIARGDGDCFLTVVLRHKDFQLHPLNSVRQLRKAIHAFIKANENTFIDGSTDMTYKDLIVYNKPPDISYDLYVQNIAIPASDREGSQWVDTAEMNVTAFLLKCFVRVFKRTKDKGGYYLTSTVGLPTHPSVVDVLFTHDGNYGHYGK
jgi:hypothetical protein